MYKQVLSIKEMQELIDMGIDVSNASMYISEYGEIISNVKICELEINWTPAFILQDILEMLPKPCYLNCIDNDFYQCEITTKNGSATTNGTSPLNAAFNMLKWCKTNNQL